MKLHLPVGLRRALLAVFAALPVLATTVSPAFGQEDGASRSMSDVSAFVASKVTLYNNAAAKNAYDTAYDTTDASGDYTKAYNAYLTDKSTEAYTTTLNGAAEAAGKAKYYEYLGVDANGNAVTGDDGSYTGVYGKAYQDSLNAAATNAYNAAYNSDKAKELYDAAYNEVMDDARADTIAEVKESQGYQDALKAAYKTAYELAYYNIFNPETYKNAAASQAYAEKEAPKTVEWIVTEALNALDTGEALLAGESAKVNYANGQSAAALSNASNIAAAKEAAALAVSTQENKAAAKTEADAAYEAAKDNDANIAAANAAGEAAKVDATNIAAAKKEGDEAAAAAKHQAGMDAVKDATYIYNETYGLNSEVSFTDKAGGTQTVDVHINAHGNQTVITESESSISENHDLAGLAAERPEQTGDLVLDKKSEITVIFGESSSELTTGDHVHDVLDSALVGYTAHNYVLGANDGADELALGEFTLKTAEGTSANSITIGLDKKATLTAAAVDVEALSYITVQKGSSITATEGAVSLTSTGNVTVKDGSSITGKTDVELTGAVVTLAASTVTAETGSVTLKDAATISVDGSSISSKGALTLNGTAAISVLNGSTLGGSAISLKSTGGSVTVSGGSAVTGTSVEVSGKTISVEKSFITSTVDGVTLKDAATISVDGSSISSKGVLTLNGTGAISVLNGSTLGGSAISLESTGGSVTVSGGSMVSANSLELSGNKISINGSGVGTRLNTAEIMPIDGDGTSATPTAAATTTPDVKLSGTTGIDITNGAQVLGVNVELTSTAGTVSVNSASTVSGDGVVTLNGAAGIVVDGEGTVVKSDNGSVTLDRNAGITVSGNAAVYGKNVTLNSDGAIDINGGNVGATATGTRKADTVRMKGASVTLQGEADVKAGSVYLTATDGDVVMQDTALINQTVKAELVASENISIIGANAGTNARLGSRDILLDAGGTIELSHRGSLTSTGQTKIGTDAEGQPMYKDHKVKLDAGEAIELTSGASISAEYASVELISGGSILLTDASISAKNKSITLTANGGDITTTGEVNAAAGAVSMTASKGITLGSMTSGNTGVTLTANGGNITTTGEVNAAAGAVNMTASKGITLNSKTSGNTGVTLTAKGGDISSTGSISATTGDVNLTANAKTSILSSEGGDISVSGDVTATAGAVKLEADKGISLGSKINGNTGVTLTAKGGDITTTGEVNAAAGAVSMTASNSVSLGGKVTAGTDVTLFTSSLLSRNTITNATVEAGGKFSLTGAPNELLVPTDTSGVNTISNSSITAGSTLEIAGLIHTISGSTLSGNGVTLGMKGGSLYNDIKGTTVTANTGDIAVNGIVNMVDATSTLTSTAGSITLQGSSVEGLSGILKALGSFIELPDLDITANYVSGNLSAGQLVTLNATANILNGETVVAGTGVEMGGTVNVVDGTQVSTTGGDVTMKATGSLSGSIVELLTDKLGDSISALGSIGDLLGSLEGVELNANVLNGGGLASENGSVKMDAMLNLALDSTLSAGGDVSFDGAINLATGGTISGDNVKFYASEGNTLNLGEVLGSLSGFLGDKNQEGEGGDGTTEGDSQMDLSSILTTLGSALNGNANVVLADVNAAGDLSLTGTVNVLGGNNTVGGNATLDSMANVVYGGSMNANSITLQNTGSGMDLATLVNALPDKIGDTDITALKNALKELTLGNVNANVLMKDALVMGTETVTLNGTANVLTDGAQLQGGTVALNGAANVLMGGAKVTGSAITLTGVGAALPVGDLVSQLLSSGMLGDISLPEDVENTVVSLLNGLSGSANLVYGGSTDLGNAGTGQTSLSALANVVAKNAEVWGQNVNMSGLANVVAVGAGVRGGNVSLDGVANVVYDGEITGSNISMGMSAGNAYNGLLSADAVLKLLPDSYEGYDLTALKQALSALSMNLNANVLLGENTLVDGTESVAMNGTANVVASGATVQGGNVALKALANVVASGATVDGGKVVLDGPANVVLGGGQVTGDTVVLKSSQTLGLPLGTLAGDLLPGLLPEGTTLPGALTDALDVLNGELGTNANVVTGAGSLVSGTNKVTLDATVNYVGDGATVSGGKVQLAGPVNLLLNGGQLTGGSVTMNGYGPSLNMLGVQIPAEYAAYVNQLGLNGLLDKQFGTNLVMGKDTAVTAGSITLNAGLVNMVSDRATLTAENGSLTMSSAVNMVLDGSKLEATNGTLTMSGTLNLVSHLVLNDYLAALQNGTPLPTTGALTTLYGQNVELWGGANVVHGNVSVKANDTVTMGGLGEPLIQLNSLTLQQIVDLAKNLDASELLDQLKSEALERLLGYAEENGLTDLLGAANELGLGDLLGDLSGMSMDELKNWVKDHASDSLNLSLNGNVNAVSGGASVTGSHVVMNGTLNYVGEGATITATNGKVEMNGGANIVAGGATVESNKPVFTTPENPMDPEAGDVEMNGGSNIVVDTTLGNIKDALNGDTDSFITGGSEQTSIVADGSISMNAGANLVNGGKVLLDAGEDVSMKGALNAVAGNAQVQADQDINMTGTDAVSVDLSKLLPEQYAQMVDQMGVTELLKGGLNANIVAGGADLTTGRDINMNGLASVVVDTTLSNVVDALKNQSIDPLMQGGNSETVLTAGNNINMGSRVNVVAGGKVTLDAGNNVSMDGVLNVVNGNAVVNADNAVTMKGAANVVANGADLTGKNVTLSGNKALSNEMNELIGMVLPGVELPAGVSASVLTGNGTTVHATDKAAMQSQLNMLMDGAQLKGDSQAVMAGTANAVMGGAGVSGKDVALTGSAANLVMDAGTVTATSGDVTMKAAVNAVTGGSVTAGGDITLQELGALPSGASDLLGSLIPNSEIADMVDSLLARGNANVVTDSTLKAGGNIAMYSTLNSLEGASVNAGNNIVINGGVTTAADTSMVAGNKVMLSNSVFTSEGSSVMQAANGLTAKNTTASIAAAVLGGTTNISADSVVEIAALTATKGAQILNYGELTLQEAVMTNATVANVGSMTVTGDLTMNNVTLNYSASYLNGDTSTAISLGGEGGALTLGSTSADAISRVSFVVDAALLADAFETGKEFSFVLFTNATAADLAFVQEYLNVNTEFSIGVADTTWNTIVDQAGVKIDMVGSNIVVMGNVMVPEPTTATLSLLALAGLAARRRRRH